MGNVEKDAKQRASGCNARFMVLETEWAAKKAVNGVIAKQTEDKRDIWKYVIRVLTVGIAGGVFGIVWKFAVVIQELTAKGILK